MLTIYSICRGLASHQIEFPSVFEPSGKSLEMVCGGYSFAEGGDYAVLGEVRLIGNTKVLAVIHAERVGKQDYLTHVCGHASSDGSVSGGYRYSREGAFGGLLFAVDEDGMLYLRGDSPLPRVEQPSAVLPVLAPAPVPTRAAVAQPQQEKAAAEDFSRQGSHAPANRERVEPSLKAEVPPQLAEAPSNSEVEQRITTASLGEDKTLEEGSSATKETADKPADTAGKGTGGPIPQFAWSRGAGDSPSNSDQPQGGAGEGELISGTDIRVKKMTGEDFPIAGPIPELAGVRRSELARKAEARKKVTKVAPTIAPSTPSVSSSGMKLGKDSGGDNQPRVVQNKINESELW
jgi:hypothetical protein